MTDVIEPIRGSKGATILGPRNSAVERQNPDILLPPETDHGGIPNLKFPFAMPITVLRTAAGPAR